MSRFVFVSFLALLLLASCHHMAGDRAVIRGTLSGVDGMKLTLQEMDTREIRTLDSVVPGQTETFIFSPLVKESGFWLIKAPNGKILVLLLHDGDQIELSGSARDFPDHVALTGPKDGMLLNDFYRRTRKNELTVDSLEMLLVERQDSSDYYQQTQTLDTSFRQVWESQRKDEISFINEHPGSLASLLVLNYAFGLSPVLSPEEDVQYYLKIDSALLLQYPENKHVKFHHQRVLEILRSKPAR